MADGFGLFLDTGVYGCCLWLLFMVVVYGCCLWLLFMVVVVVVVVVVVA